MLLTLATCTYRLEPLLFECPSEQAAGAPPSPSPSCVKRESSWAAVQPVDVPYWKGRDHTHTKIQNIRKLLSKSLSFRGGREEAVEEGNGASGGADKRASKSAVVATGGFRQGLSSMFRRGLKRVEKGGGADDSGGEEGLLATRKDDCGVKCPSQHCVDANLEQETARRAEVEEFRGPNSQDSVMKVNVDEDQSDGGRGFVKQAGEEKKLEPLVCEEANGMVRVDFKLQRSAAESMSDFITSIRSHRSVSLSSTLTCIHCPTPLFHCVFRGFSFEEVCLFVINTYLHSLSYSSSTMFFLVSRSKAEILGLKR